MGGLCGVEVKIVKESHKRGWAGHDVQPGETPFEKVQIYMLE